MCNVCIALEILNPDKYAADADKNWAEFGWKDWEGRKLQVRAWGASAEFSPAFYQYRIPVKDNEGAFRYTKWHKTKDLAGSVGWIDTPMKYLEKGYIDFLDGKRKEPPSMFFRRLKNKLYWKWTKLRYHAKLDNPISKDIEIEESK